MSNQAVLRVIEQPLTEAHDRVFADFVDTHQKQPSFNQYLLHLGAALRRDILNPTERVRLENLALKWFKGNPRKTQEEVPQGHTIPDSFFSSPDYSPEYFVGLCRLYSCPFWREFSQYLYNQEVDE